MAIAYLGQQSRPGMLSPAQIRYNTRQQQPQQPRIAAPAPAPAPTPQQAPPPPPPQQTTPPPAQVTLPPPAPAPAPQVAPAQNAQPPNAIPLSGLGGLLERQLANPSRYGQEEAKKTYEYLSQNLEDQAKQAEQGAIANAASRGVYYGSPLTTSLGDIGTQLMRGKGDLAAQIAREQALTEGTDRQAAIGNAFRFGENQTAADQFAAQLGLQATGMGFGGAPDINSTIGAIAGQPFPQAQPADLSGLGALAGLAQPQVAAPMPTAAVAPPVAPAQATTPRAPLGTFRGQPLAMPKLQNVPGTF